MSADSAVNAALLNMCAQVQDSRSSGATATATPAAPTARPATDYEWLRTALASVESPEKKLKQLLFNMENKRADGQDGPVDPEDRLEAVEELSDMVEDVNWAAEFTLMQGPERVLRVLKSERETHPLTGAKKQAEDAGEGETVASATAAEHSNVLTAASLSLYRHLAMIVAHSAQLNEPVQSAYQAVHWEEVLLALLQDCVAATRAALEKTAVSTPACEEADETSRVATGLMGLLAALLHACSCLCREHPLNSIQFIQHGGLAVMADVLQLTLRATTAVRAQAAEAIPAVTTVHTDGKTGGAESASAIAGVVSGPDGTEETAAATDPLMRTANKVTARAFFFAGYLASTGVSSEDVIRLTCQHAEANADEQVQKAAARELLELVAKSPKAIKDAVHAHMPRRFYEWRSVLQRVVAGGEAEGDLKDERQSFVEALGGSN